MTIDPNAFDAAVKGAAPPDGPDAAGREWLDLERKLAETPDAEKPRLRVMVAAAKERLARLLSGQTAAGESFPTFKAIGELGPWLTEPPPPRRWLLRRGDEGVLPLEVVGMLAALGGGGKTWALILLALSVAAGIPWLGTFEVVDPGNVLLLLGEEPESEVRWRLFYAAQELGLTAEEKALAATRIFPLALAGRQVALTLSAEVAEATGCAELPETAVAQTIRAQLAGREWRLILVDPLSRFAGPDVELDNAQATRFVQVLETLARADGGPAVLFAHHTGKAARKDSALGSDATAARGSSALSDAARWQANLVPLRKLPEDLYPASEPRHLSLVISKSTRAPEGADLRLVRGRFGVLRPATEVETRTYDKAAGKVSATKGKATRDDRVATLKPEILAALADKARDATALAAKLDARREDVNAACAALSEAGEIVRTAGPRSPWTLPAGGKTDQSDQAAVTTPEKESDHAPLLRGVVSLSAREVSAARNATRRRRPRRKGRA